MLSEGTVYEHNDMLRHDQEWVDAHTAYGGEMVRTHPKRN